MFDKMKDLMAMKKQADQIKRQLDAERVDVETGNGIKLVVNGSQNFLSVQISEDLLSADKKSKLETEMLKSVNQAIAKSQQVAAQKMKAVMPGF